MKYAKTDGEVKEEILRIEREIEHWVRAKGLWGDCGFSSYIDYVDAEPWEDNPVVTIFCSDGEFNIIFFDSDGELYEDFSSMLDRNGYWFERDTGRVYVVCKDGMMNERYKEYFHRQWIFSLLKPDFNDIHHELFLHFQENPKAFMKLRWREFEILIYELLRHQGFHVELGPGRGDGGIDIRMVQRDPIGDILTAVQVKRYRPDRKINLQAIQALHGAAMANAIPQTAFVTTSSYLPSAKNFAERENVKMSLFLSEDVVEWCKYAHRGIIEEKRRLVSDESMRETLELARKNPREYVFHAHQGITMSWNSFAVKLMETKHAALLMTLPSRISSHDGYEQRGYEIPVLDSLAETSTEQKPELLAPGKIFRAKRSGKREDGSFWTGNELYSVWNDAPQWFDMAD